MLELIKDKVIKRNLILLLLIPFSVVLLALAKAESWWVEYLFARGIYRFVSVVISIFTGLFPFSLAEVLLVLFIIGLPVYIVFKLVKIIRNRKSLELFRSLSGILAIFSIGYFIFASFLSLNYNRHGLTEILDYSESEPCLEELIEATGIVVDRLNALSSQIVYNQDGSSVYKDGFYAMANTAKKSIKNLDSLNKGLKGAAVRPKPVFFSELMNYLGISGIYSPITFEANVNRNTPHFALPQIMLHELSHLRGVMREDEAEYLGYKACVMSDDLFFRYSGYMMAYNELESSLYKADKAAWQEVCGRLSPKILKDRDNYFKFYKKYEGKASEISSSINDSYLKSQGVEEGKLSYNQVLRIIMAEYKTHGDL